MRRRTVAAWWMYGGFASCLMMIACQSEGLRPARPADLESRYSCGGGGSAYAPETGIRWYREWDGCYVKYPRHINMAHKMWTVGKMDYRPETIHGGPDNEVMTLPYPGTHAPNEELIAKIFEAEAPFIQQTIEYSDDHRGNYWAVANEPNWRPYFTPEDYARSFHTYATFVKGLDPTAKMTSGGILVSHFYTGPNYAGTEWNVWIDEFRAAYESLYGTPPPVDVWDIHPYDACSYFEDVTPARRAIDNIIAMRQYLDNVGLTDDPIWISEVACFTDDSQTQVDYINELFAWLNENAEAYKVERWFWWGSTTKAFGPTGLFDGPYNRDNINVQGDAYMKQMGRVFVDPDWEPDATRIRGSMRNPYASLEEVVEAGLAGHDGLCDGNIVYDFSTGTSHVFTIPPHVGN